MLHKLEQEEEEEVYSFLAYVLMYVLVVAVACILSILYGLFLVHFLLLSYDLSEHAWNLFNIVVSHAYYSYNEGNVILSQAAAV